MCGIFLSNDPLIDSRYERVIEETLRFRGPDCASGLKFIGEWKAYHSRLAIIDPETGTNQPVLNKNGSILVFNGEILNYKELGFKYFNTEYYSDTYLLNDLILSNKLDLNELDGFFSFAFVESNGKLKYCVRDKFGVKPLFYFQRNGFITICSEPSTLMKIYSLKVSKDAVDEYKLFRAPLLSGSFFEGVKQVEPGHCLVNEGYFDAKDYINENYIEVSTDELRKELEIGIKTREVSDVPIALLLSKGVDSNLIFNHSSVDKYYSIGFEGDEDFDYLNSQKIDNLTLVECSPEEYKDAFYFLLNLRCEPMSVPNEVLIYILAKKAAQDGVKVLLSGEGADEFFGGYDRVFQWASKVKEFDFDIFMSMYAYRDVSRDSLVYDKIKNIFDRIDANPFEKVRWFFIRYHMPILFRRLDFATMAAGIEGREPIANKHLFDIAMKLSSEVLMGDSLGKLPLRYLLSESMGEDFAFEKKVGFPVDLKSIFSEKSNRSNYDIWFDENLKVLSS